MQSVFTKIHVDIGNKARKNCNMPILIAILYFWGGLPIFANNLAEMVAGFQTEIRDSYISNSLNLGQLEGIRAACGFDYSDRQLQLHLQNWPFIDWDTSRLMFGEYRRGFKHWANSRCNPVSHDIRYREIRTKWDFSNRLIDFELRENFQAFCALDNKFQTANAYDPETSVYFGPRLKKLEFKCQ